jgi:DNA polymerase-3 subunit epsilon
MKVLLDNARKPTYRIWSEGAPYDLKDHLKARGYRWSDGSDGRPKAWYIDIDEENHEAELKWLDDKVYQGSHAKPLVKRISAFERYSQRLLRE